QPVAPVDQRTKVSTLVTRIASFPSPAFHIMHDLRSRSSRYGKSSSGPNGGRSCRTRREGESTLSTSSADVPDPTGAPSDLPPGTSARKVLILDLDGVRLDKLREADTPNIDALAKEGRFGPTMTHGTTLAPT